MTEVESLLEEGAKLSAAIDALERAARKLAFGHAAPAAPVRALVEDLHGSDYGDRVQAFTSKPLGSARGRVLSKVLLQTLPNVEAPEMRRRFFHAARALVFLHRASLRDTSAILRGMASTG